MLIIAEVLKEEWLEITGFAHSQTTNKLVNKAANDSARVSGQDRKKPPARKLRKKEMTIFYSHKLLKIFFLKVDQKLLFI